MTLETSATILGLTKLLVAYWAIRLFFKVVVADVERAGKDRE